MAGGNTERKPEPKTSRKDRFLAPVALVRSYLTMLKRRVSTAEAREDVQRVVKILSGVNSQMQSMTDAHVYQLLDRYHMDDAEMLKMEVQLRSASVIYLSKSIQLQALYDAGVINDQVLKMIDDISEAEEELMVEAAQQLGLFVSKGV